MVMNEIHNPFEVLRSEFININKKIDLLIRRTGKVDLFDEFNIEGVAKAAKILNRSTKTILTHIKKGDIMIEYIHYRKSEGGRYTFSQGALLKIKGLI